MNPKDIVRDGYDRVSHAYRTDSGDEARADYAAWIDALRQHVPVGAAVLDLGCGCGVPTAQLLAADYGVTGVDLSPVQIARAQQLVPQARFLCADMAALDFPPGSFAAVVSFYAIIHVPMEEQPGLFRSIRRWLQPGGYLLATLGADSWTGTEDDWLGVTGGTMYWSHADGATYERWLHEAGFTVCWARFVPEGDGGHTLVLAQAATLAHL
ncbi:MAG: class I SAM-dependent methyltransferase [Chloroflexales bacterium]|nr:class I SAM-dependent methyltransferase [Chloroflexales bacterium]